MVFSRFFKKPYREDHFRTYSIPPGERVYAVGDIHGRADLLESLFLDISKDYENRGRAKTTIVFLGDLVDRGAESRRVVERLMALAESPMPCVFLAGNHEELFLKVCGGEQSIGGVFHRAGGRETLLSYGVDPELYDKCEPSQISALADQHVPEAHRAFLASFQDYWVCGDYCFVHAGIRPGVALEEQENSDLRWIRREFIESDADHGLMIIHGHTITEQVDEQPNRIGIDTGAYASGKLTAIGLEGSERWFLST